MILQVLYAMELRNDFRIAVAEEILGRRNLTEPDSQEFIFDTVRGVVEHREEIDGWIEKCSEHWSLPRIAVVEGSILRTAVFELLYTTKVPIEVIINEAVELANLYGGEDSGGFVNGILDQVAHRVRSDSSEGEVGQLPG